LGKRGGGVGYREGLARWGGSLMKSLMAMEVKSLSLLTRGKYMPKARREALLLCNFDKRG
jgi:hypothetical protein